MPFDGDLILIKDGIEIIVLNETARLIWEAIGDGNTSADAAAQLVEKYGLSRQRSQADVDATLTEWRGRGLIAGDAPLSRLEAFGPSPITPTANAPPSADLESVRPPVYR